MQIHGYYRLQDVIHDLKFIATFDKDSKSWITSQKHLFTLHICILFCKL
jgi:hypothetical protein